MKITSIQVKPTPGGRRCTVMSAQHVLSFVFADFFEFDEGIARVLLETERLIAPNAIHATPEQRNLLAIQSLYVEDAGERNKRTIAGREVLERRAEGEFLCGGAWYMEVNLFSSSTDASFSTVEELYQTTQSIIQRELALAGHVLVPGAAEFAHA